MTTTGPVRVCADTWLITHLTPAPPLGKLFCNSAVIDGAQPLVIDTGCAGNRAAWLTQLTTLLDPTTVRWVFISHDDADHIGNLPALRARCPDATLLLSWLTLQRLTLRGELGWPPDRIRVVDDGCVDIGDRVLRMVRPPVFDNPGTLGLVDQETGFFWAADCFAAPVAKFLIEADDTVDAHWRAGFLTAHRLLSPWHTLIDPRRYAPMIDRLEQLPIAVAAGAHGPIVRGDRLTIAWRMLRELPHLRPPERFDPAAADYLNARMRPTVARLEIAGAAARMAPGRRKNRVDAEDRVGDPIGGTVTSEHTPEHDGEGPR
jgi:hypothetical protein